MNARVLAWGGYLLFLLLVAWILMTRLSVSSDMSVFLPRGASEPQQLLIEQLRRGINGRVILLGMEGAPPAALAAANKTLARQLRDSGYFSWVNNGVVRPAALMDSPLFRYRYLLSPAIGPGYFSEAALRAALEKRLPELASALSPLAKRFLAADPTGEYLRLLQRWRGERPLRRMEGVYFSADGAMSLMLLAVRDTGTDLARQAEAVAAIREGFAAAAPKGARLLLSGPGVIAVETRESIRSDTRRLSLTASLIVVVFLFLAFRSWRVILLSAVPLATGILGGLAACALVFGTVHGITIAFGSTLLGIAVDYPMHFFSHLRRVSRSPAEPLLRIWPTLRLGVLTTLIGFSALFFSDYGGLAQLGLFAIAGLAGAAAATRWLLPALVPAGFVIPPTLDYLQRHLRRLAALAPRGRWAAWGLLALAVGVLAWKQDRLWENDPANLSPLSEQRRHTDNLLRERLQVPYANRLIMVAAPGQEQVLREVERLTARLAPLQAQGVLSGYEAVTRYLPSRARQRQRQQWLPEPAVLKRALVTASRSLPFHWQAFGPFLEDVARARRQPPLTLEDLERTALGERLAPLLFRHGDAWAAPILLYGVRDTRALGALVDARGPVRSYFIDTKQASSAMLASYRDRTLGLVGWGGLAILAVLSLGLASLRRGLRIVFVPLAVVLADAALLSLLGARLNLFHLISLLLVMGLGIDYALFFERLERHAGEWVSTFPALWKSWLTTVLVFGSLSLSTAPVLQAIGLTVSLGVTLCFLLGAVWVRRAPVPEVEEG